MGFLEDFIVMFGFKKQSDVIAIICFVVLLGNLFGGLMSNILLAHGGSIDASRKLTQKTSFRLALVSELMVVIYAIYYHTVLVTGIDAGQALLWGFTLIAAPLLASFGAQATYLIFKKAIEERRKRFTDRKRAERDAANGNGAMNGAANGAAANGAEQ